MSSIYKRLLISALMLDVGTFFFSATAQVGAKPSTVKPGAVKPVAIISKVTVSGGSGGVDVEISSTQPITLRSQAVTGPDRLILDFPDASPGPDLRNQAINRGEVKGVRISLFTQHPSLTRVVIDLKSPQPYRIYPSGKTVIVKLVTGEKQVAGAHTDGAHVDAVSYTPPPQPAPTMAVEYKSGRLSILAERVSLAQVLNEVQRKTGADIPIPSMAAQEQVIVNTGLLPVREALASLLNGSRFNFVIVGSDGDPSKVKSVILTFRGGGGGSSSIPQPAVAPPEPADTEGQPEPVLPSQLDNQPQPEVQPAPQEEAPPPQDNPPPQ